MPIGTPPSQYPAGTTPAFPAWMQDLNIPQIWKYSTGKNVGVAVIDTGINIQNNDLPYNKDNYYIFDKTVSLQDTQGHGTHCAGLIGARNKNGQMIGVAPECSLTVCKIAEGDSLDEPDTLRYANAINWCSIQKDIHVISISWGSFMDDEAIVSKIQEAVNLAVRNNKVVVCAMGDATQFGDPGPVYPAALFNTIGVGVIPADNRLFPYINSSLVTATIGNDIASYGIGNKIVTLSGTSQANAIVAGIVALIIQKKKFNYTPAEIKGILTAVSSPYNYQDTQIPVLNKDLLLNYFQS